MSPVSRNIAFNLLGQFLTLVIGFLGVKYVYAVLGRDSLGIIYFSLTLNAVLVSVLEKGINSTTVREVSRHAAGEAAYVARYLRLGSLICWGAVLLFAVAIYVLSQPIVDGWLKFEALRPEAAIWPVRLLGAGLVLSVVTAYYAAVLQGFQKVGAYNLVEVVVNLAQQAGILAAATGGGDIVTISVWVALCYLLKAVALGFLCGRLAGYRSLLPGWYADVAAGTVRYFRETLLVSVISMFHRQLDKVLISALLPIGHLGAYSSIYGGIAKVGMVSSAFAQALFPVFCIAHRRGRGRALMRAYRLVQDAVCFSVLPLFMAILFVEKFFLEYVFDQDMERQLRLPVLLLSIGYYLNATLSVPYRVALATNQNGLVIRHVSYALLLVWPLAAWLASIYGMAGAAAGCSLYFLCGYYFVIPKLFEGDQGRFLREFFTRLAKVGLVGTVYFVPYGAMWLADFQGLTLAGVAVLFLALTTIYAAAAYRAAGRELRGAAARWLRTRVFVKR